jgi:hypothetical protein
MRKPERNPMELLGASIEGTYNLVPPPQVGGIFKRIKRGVKKAGRVAKKVGKKGVKVAVKVHTKPLKLAAKAGKYAMKGVAKLAAKPVVYAFKKLARRRAGYLAYQTSKTTKATSAQKREAANWALQKVNKAGPIGKLAVRILRFVDAHKSAGVGLETIAIGYEQDAAACGMTGAEIAAAAASIVAALAALMRSLNKPGQAPSNPAAAAKTDEPAEDVQPVIESAEEGEGEVTENETAGFFNRAKLKKLQTKWRRNRLARRLGVPVPPPPPRRRRAKAHF